jgi:uncharacterized protein
MRTNIEFDQIDEQGPQDYAAAFEVPLADFLREELAGVGPVTVEVHAEQGGSEGEYSVEGRVRFTADYTCSRCVEPYPIANDSTFHVLFRPRPAGLGEMEEVEITHEGELDVEFYSERSIPLRDLAIEQVQLSIPMKPLCEDKCLGLCTTCGANRNREQCACGESVVDDRWGALQDIRVQLAKKKDI